MESNLNKDITNPKLMCNAIRSYVDLILKYINNEEIKQLKETDEAKYKQLLNFRFKEFISEYPVLFKCVVNGQNIEMLELMLKGIEHLNDAPEDLETVRYALGQKLHDIYVEPSLNNSKNELSK